MTGPYRRFDRSNRLVEKGDYYRGEKVGTWVEITAGQTMLVSRLVERRVGAICMDGTRSYATGRGACSWHGGVSTWLY